MCFHPCAEITGQADCVHGFEKVNAKISAKVMLQSLPDGVSYCMDYSTKSVIAANNGRL